MSDAPLMLSISGLRGLIGKSLTAPVAARYGAAFGQWLKGQVDNGVAHVVVGRDSRPSGQMIEQAVVSGLIGVGCKVTQLGIVSTPGVAIMVEALGAHGGMVITASHNPIIWNGIKALRADGTAPAADQAAEIIERFKNDNVEYAPVQDLQLAEVNDQACDIHVARVLKHVDVEAIRARKFKVVLDSVHGAGGPEAKLLLENLGVELVHLYGEPTGQFPHVPEPLKENLTELAQVVAKEKADVGFAQDPDADRVAIVDENGTYIGEEYSLALATKHALTTRTDEQPIVVINLSTSRMCVDLAEAAGGKVIKTPVGEANVAGGMREYKAVFGGEGSGGVIDPKVIYVRNSLAGIALTLEMLAKSDKTLNEHVAEIPAYYIHKEKMPIREGMAPAAIEALSKHFTDQQVDLQDGIRIDWPDRWAQLRPSNTEPIVRITTEAKDQATAEALADEVRSVIGL